MKKVARVAYVSRPVSQITCVLVALGSISLGCAVQDSSEHKSVAEPSKRPNILLVVADDLGYTDLGAFGSEIETPSLDEIAQNGVILTRFYTSFTCSPSRAMLLTGVDNHIAGLGNMSEFMAANQRDKPGYEGVLNQRVLTLAERLKVTGYHTYMAGKWHLGEHHDQSPHARGFERSFALLNGGGSHFADRAGVGPQRTPALYREDGELVEELPQDFYSSDFYTDRIIEYIGRDAADKVPFFAYLAFTAPHWPLQARDQDLDNQAGKYDEGYDAVRADRLNRVRQKNLIAAADVPNRPATVLDWNHLSEIEMRRHARSMEVYAAMVANMDANVGRLVRYLQDLGLYQNTLIFFMSDNGADGLRLNVIPALAEYEKRFDNRIENLGRPGSFIAYGAEWAHVGEAPFKLYKGFATEGGLRSPAFVAYPGKVRAGAITSELITVMDVLPTILQFAGVDLRDDDSGREQPTGRSFSDLLTGNSRSFRGGDESVAFELWGHRAVLMGSWKLLYTPKPLGSGQWSLYDLASDPGELQDLALQQAAIMQQLIQRWEDYVVENNVIIPDSWELQPPGQRPTH